MPPFQVTLSSLSGSLAVKTLMAVSLVHDAKARLRLTFLAAPLCFAFLQLGNGPEGQA